MLIENDKKEPLLRMFEQNQEKRRESAANSNSYFRDSERIIVNMQTQSSGLGQLDYS